MQIFLAKSTDWDIWFSFVKARAINFGVWELVDPTQTTRPIKIVKPVEPEAPQMQSTANFDRDASENYKINSLIFRNKLVAYENQQQGIIHLITFIQETITAQNAIYIQYVEPHPWDQLRALQARLAPTDTARLMDIEARYEKLIKGPGEQDMETYLVGWEQTYTQVKERKLYSDKKAVRDFLVALGARESQFSDAHLMTIDKTDFELFALIVKVRLLVRMKDRFELIN